MKKLYKTILLFIFSVICSNVSSQTYMEKDANGEKVYYKLMSAAPNYINKCIEDNIRNARYSNYYFLIKDTAYNNMYQQWQLIPAASSGYYMRNKGSGRYMKIDDTYWVGSYMCPSYIGTKYGASVFDFVSIGDDQVIMRFTDSNEDLRYLNAVDSTWVESNVINLSDIQNTANAWIVRNSDGTPVGVHSLTAGSDINISVINRKIIVLGCDNYSIYDLQGRDVDESGTMVSGAYIIRAKGKSYKVLVP